MKKILETDRLFLRELTVLDSESFYLLNQNPKIIQYTGDKAFDNLDDAKNFLQNYGDYIINGYGRWAVILKSNNQFLGWCGLKYNSDIKETDIGFRFFEDFWNYGYATESSKACIQYGFEHLKLNKIIGRAKKYNLASIKVLEKIGLTYKKNFNFDGDEGVLYETENNL